MAHRKQLLHELLKEDQEPFELNTHIADKRFQLKKPSTSTAVQLRHRKPITADGPAKLRGGNLCRHACFFTFQDVHKSPFSDFSISPAKSPGGKSPNHRAVLLHIPSRTAALLLEAALRIQKQQQKPNSGSPSKNVGFELFGSFMKRLRLRDRNKNKKRTIEDRNFSVKEEENAAKSCSCSVRRISSAEWTDDNEVKSPDFGASTSSYGSDWSEDHFGFSEPRFCVSPFRFSFHKSPSSSNGCCTPEFCSPAASPGHHLSKEKEPTEKCDKGEEDEDINQSSPVSVLDPVFQEDDGPESGCCNDGDELDDYDIECSYANVQRAKEQLLFKLRRFEKLAELNPMELEGKLLEESDDTDNLVSEDERPSSPDTLVTQVFNQSDLQTIPADMKKLVSDLIAEEKKNQRICSGEAVVGRICKRLDSWREVELDTIDMMVGLDLKKKEGDGWTEFIEQVEETKAEMEVAVCGLLVDELLEELCYMDRVIGFLLR